jgi:hypothetical protein
VPGKDRPKTTVKAFNRLLFHPKPLMENSLASTVEIVTFFMHNDLKSRLLGNFESPEELPQSADRKTGKQEQFLFLLSNFI